MSETIDDTESFKIGLDAEPVTCNGGSPHYGTGCALLKHYDDDGDGIVTSRDSLRAMQDGMTTEESQFILNASTRGSINALCPGCYTPPATPAKGALISMDYPAKAKAGSSISFSVTVKNVGGSEGTFTAGVFLDGVIPMVAATPRFNLAAGRQVTKPIPGLKMGNEALSGVVNVYRHS